MAAVLVIRPHLELDNGRVAQHIREAAVRQCHRSEEAVVTEARRLASATHRRHRGQAAEACVVGRVDVLPAGIGLRQTVQTDKGRVLVRNSHPLRCLASTLGVMGV